MATSQAQTVIAAVDALVSRDPDLPPPHVRGRLRRADRLTQPEVAAVIGVNRVQVARWESGRAEPRKPNRAAYARLLKQLAAKHPRALQEASVT